MEKIDYSRNEIIHLNIMDFLLMKFPKHNLE